MKFSAPMTKKIIAFAISAVTFLSMTVTASAAEGFLTNDRVNFRAEGNMEAEIFETLDSGVPIHVIEYDAEGWSKVVIDEKEGYIKSEFLTDLSVEQPPSPPIIETQVSEGAEGVDQASAVELLPWSEVKELFTTYTPARVLDVRTGKTYYVQSFSNGLHADVETLTQADTDILLATYGGKWEWDPRPVWVTINGRTMAGSINGMPHGGGTISGNGLDGQVCIHFQGSATHNGNTVFEQDHQLAVVEAWNAR